MLNVIQEWFIDVIASVFEKEFFFSFESKQVAFDGIMEVNIIREVQLDPLAGNIIYQFSKFDCPTCAKLRPTTHSFSLFAKANHHILVTFFFTFVM